MASWTSPVIHATSDVLAVADYNGVANNTTFLAQAPYAVYYLSGSQNIPDGVTTQVQLNTTSISNYGFSLTSDNAIVPIAGIYSVLGSVVFSSSAGYSGALMNTNVFHNGVAAVPGTISPIGTFEASATAQGLISCQAGDTIGLFVYQNSGVSLPTLSGVPTSLTAFFVGFQ